MNWVSPPLVGLWARPRIIRWFIRSPVAICSDKLQLSLSLTALVHIPAPGTEVYNNCLLSFFHIVALKLWEFSSGPPRHRKAHSLIWQRKVLIQLGLKTLYNHPHCRFLVPGNTQEILTKIWHQFWDKNDGENICHWYHIIFKSHEPFLSHQLTGPGQAS